MDWLGTYSGLARFDPGPPPTFTFYGADTNLPQDPSWNLRAIYQDGEGTLWLATQGRGILLFDPDAETFLSSVHHDPLRPTSLSGNRGSTFYFTLPPKRG